MTPTDETSQPTILPTDDDAIEPGDVLWVRQNSSGFFVGGTIATANERIFTFERGDSDTSGPFLMWDWFDEVVITSRAPRRPAPRKPSETWDINLPPYTTIRANLTSAGVGDDVVSTSVVLTNFHDGTEDRWADETGWNPRAAGFSLDAFQVLSAPQDATVTVFLNTLLDGLTDGPDNVLAMAVKIAREAYGVNEEALHGAGR